MILVVMALATDFFEGNKFTIDKKNETWHIRIYKTSKSKGMKVTESSISGYWSLKSAENDVPRLDAHMSQGPGFSRLDRFIPNLEGTIECRYSNEVCCAPLNQSANLMIVMTTFRQSEVDEGKF